MGKLECLVALCRALLHPQLTEEKIWDKIFSSTKMKVAQKKKCLSCPEITFLGGGVLPRMDRQLDGQLTSQTDK